MGLQNFNLVRSAIDDLQTNAGTAAHARCDEASYAFLEQELLQIRTKTYDILYPELRGRQIVPIDHAISPGAETYAWDSWDKLGIAGINGNDTDDAPMAEVTRDRKVGRIINVKSAYKYTLFELASQAMAGVPLTSKRAETARLAIERQIDRLIAYGDASTGQLGFLDLPGVLTSTASGTWSATADAGDILADLNLLVSEQVNEAKDTMVLPNVLVMPLKAYNLIASKPISTLNQTPILQVFLANSPYIKKVIPWLAAGYTSAGVERNKIISFMQSDEVCQYVVSQEFTQLAPQVRNYAYIVNCFSRVGGIELHYPLGIRSMIVTIS
jgi:hypothetical protein